MLWGTRSKAFEDKNSIILTLTMDNRSHKVKKHYQTSKCRFRFGEVMLVEIKFNIMQNMILNNEFKQCREIIENRNVSIVAHSDMIASFKYMCSSHFLP
jgi:hypothetical protein